jgi:hypothetical protein
MKKKGVLMVTASTMMLFTQLGYSQKDSVTTSAKIRKNEIGLDIGSVLLFSLGSSEFTQPIGISYKRVVNDWVFRTSVSTRAKYNQAPLFNHDQVFYNDSIYYVRSGLGKTNYYVARVGAEYRYKFKRNFMFVTGCDFQTQMLKGRTQWVEYAHRIDSVANAGTGQEYNYTTLVGTRTVMEENSKGYQFGLGVSTGLLFPIGKKWSVLAQARVSAVVGPLTKTVTDNIIQTTTKNRSVFYDFETGPALAEISVFYRF